MTIGSYFIEQVEEEMDLIQESLPDLPHEGMDFFRSLVDQRIFKQANENNKRKAENDDYKYKRSDYVGQVY